jgi:hypothetical protein
LIAVPLRSCGKNGRQLLVKKHQMVKKDECLPKQARDSR